MTRFIMSAAMALACFLLLASGANATTFSFTCTGAAGELQPRLNGTSAWTVGGTAKPASGDTIEIDGTTNNAFCNGDIFVATSGLTFRNHLGSEGVIPADIINGMFEVSGAHITIDGILMLCTGCSPTTTNTTGLSGFGEDGALALHDGATVVLKNSVVAGSQTSGIFLTRNSAISVVSSSIANNGQSGTGGGEFASGIFAGAGSSVRLGNPDGSGTVGIGGNGKSGGVCPGFGVFLAEGSSLTSFAANMGGAGTSTDVNSQNNCGQIMLQGASSARIEGTTITQTTANFAALQAFGGSSIVTTKNAASAVTTISSGANGAILLGGAASAMFNSSTISSTGTAVAAVEAAASSTIILASGNNISAATAGGIAFQVDHSSSLFQIQGTNFGFTNSAETVTGSAFIQVQSSMDVGTGLVGGLPSMNWTVPSGSCILVQQNSSFRMSGGVAIAGAAPAACALNGGTISSTIVFQQESNGFFNLSRGGTDNIGGGGGVSCLFAGMPNAHVTGKANISPAGAQPVIIGSWAAASTATSPGCLGP
jgi:hypothetical protein